MYRSRLASVLKSVTCGGQLSPRLPNSRLLPSDVSGIGFHGGTPTTSARLADAVAATIALGTLSLCAGVVLAVLSIKAGMALPMPN